MCDPYKDGPHINFTIKDGKIISVNSEGNAEELLKKLMVEASGFDSRK